MQSYRVFGQSLGHSAAIRPYGRCVREACESFKKTSSDTGSRGAKKLHKDSRNDLWAGALDIRHCPPDPKAKGA